MDSHQFIQRLLDHNYQFITGVPDSTFTPFLQALHNEAQFDHMLCNNEGEACALASGYHLATGNVPIVYLQNSGFGNCMNPLTSLMDPQVYAIPALLMIGWRGHPDANDQPQHLRMGSVMTELLDLLSIPYVIADDTINDQLTVAQQHFEKHSSPFALLFQPGFFKASQKQKIKQPEQSREQLIESIISHYDDALFVATTGKTARELFAVRKRLAHKHDQDFLTVGSMGCAASIALGIARYQPNKRIVLLDGDGACLMRLEAMATIGHYQPSNLTHIIIDNESYESTGAQATLSPSVNFAEIARACGYPHAEYLDALPTNDSQLACYVIKVPSFSRNDLPRPDRTPIENKHTFMAAL